MKVHTDLNGFNTSNVTPGASALDRRADGYRFVQLTEAAIAAESNQEGFGLLYDVLVSNPFITANPANPVKDRLVLKLGCDHIAAAQRALRGAPVHYRPEKGMGVDLVLYGAGPKPIANIVELQVRDYEEGLFRPITRDEFARFFVAVRYNIAALRLMIQSTFWN